MLLTKELSLWDFACELYAQQAVQAACLQLQDEAGFDVPLLLFCCWAGLRYGAVSQPQLQAAKAFVEECSVATNALRECRRTMKNHYQSTWPVPESYWQELRERVKTAELESERLALHGLEQLLVSNPVQPGSVEAMVDNIHTCFNCNKNKALIDQMATVIAGTAIASHSEAVAALLSVG